jgi:hypothetical protein
MRLLRTAAPRWYFDENLPTPRLHREYLHRAARRLIIPTLDGPRLRRFHLIPVRKLEQAWPGEKLAFTTQDLDFVSRGVPGNYVRYVLVCLYHLSESWVPPTRQGHPIPRYPEHPAPAAELSLAKVEMRPDDFDRYCDWRLGTCTAEGWRNLATIVSLLSHGNHPFVRLWEEAGVPSGRTWELGLEGGAFKP